MSDWWSEKLHKKANYLTEQIFQLEQANERIRELENTLENAQLWSFNKD